MNKILQTLLGISLTIAVIVCLATAINNNIGWLAFMSGGTIGVIFARWSQLEFPEEKNGA